jgi:3alpha(or 20beta)-hydroxysteroid dehydrogenase
VREGAQVVLTDIRDDLGERAAASLRAEGHDARYLHLDVTSERNWAQVVDAVMPAHGRLYILFNNAGVGFSARVEDITVDIWDPRARRACHETFVDRCPSRLRNHA